MSFRHEPVLVEEVVRLLQAPERRRLLDGTVGGGGHAAALLEAMPDAELLGLDRDDEALAAAAERLHGFGDRVHLVRSAFGDLREAAATLGWQKVDVVLLDVGVSSHQIDTAVRGFAHRLDGPLDMRMDRRARMTAATVLNQVGEDELVRIFREYGEEPRSRQVARAIVARRAQKPWERTRELAELIERVAGGPAHRGLPVATRCFQALRIAVNDELGELERGLAAALALLNPGGRLAVISFHSLEDRMVKQFIRAEATTCICPPGLPVCMCRHRARLEPVTRKPVSPQEPEIAVNRRASPARLRVATRL